MKAMKMCRWACGHTLGDHVRHDKTRERLKVETITERCRKARLWRLAHAKRRDQGCVGRQHREMLHLGKKNMKNNAEMDGVCQPGHESFRDDRR